MATKHHTTVPWGAIASLILALAIGSAPVATLLALQDSVEALQ